MRTTTRRTSRSAALAALLVGLAAAPLALAQQQVDPAPPEQQRMDPIDETTTFDSLDVDRDGYLSREEIPAEHPLAKNFALADADGDGKLSREEFESGES